MLRTRQFHLIRNRRGSALVVTAVSLIVIMGVMALVLDGGLLMAERRHAQSVADTSALAAAYSLYNNYATDKGLDPTGSAKKVGRSIASGNGYANDVTTSTVTVNIPPLTGAFLGKRGYAEVVVQYNQPRCFSAVWGAGTMAVTARTVARGKVKGVYGVILLDPTMPDALSGVGNARIAVPNGKIAVNSNNSTAAQFVGNAGATAQTINITGGSSAPGGAYVGMLTLGATPTPDPLTSLPVPDKTMMSVQRTTPLSMNSQQSQTIDPGVYTGGISMSGGSSLTMMPGNYYIDGGGISTTGTASITGNDVFIYNGGSTVGSISLAGSSSISLTPPTSGAYEGISIFQDRTSTAALSLVGSGGIQITGGIYAAQAPASLKGTSATAIDGSFLIVDSATLTGNATINVGTGAGGGYRDTRIVE